MRRGRMLRQFPVGKIGYLCVRLSKDGHATTRTVHTLVLEAFAGPCPEGQEARHLHGNHLDNRAGKLSWGTKSENTLDQVAHGTHHHSRKTKCPRGHDYDYVTPAGSRQCKKCQRINDARRKGAQLDQSA